jgi:hypothetical protein
VGGLAISSQVVSARVPNADAEQLRRRAKEHGESVSPYLGTLIRSHLSERPSPEDSDR